MDSDRVKNQHYVPQAYLRLFSNSAEQIWVYDKKSGSAFQTRIRNIASENCFYDSDSLQDLVGNRQFIERHLRGIEGGFAEVSRSILQALSSGCFKGIRRRHRHFLSAYLVIQMLRTRESRTEKAQLAEFFSNFIRREHEKAGLRAPTTEEILGGMSPEDAAREQQVASLLDVSMIEEFARVLYGHIWFIQEAPSGHVLITSDHPFAKHAHIQDPLRGTDGIASKGVEILFPLSPRYVLTLIERSHFQDLSHIDGSLRRMSNPENVVYCNQFQVRDCSRFVFSRTNDFSLVEDILKQQPVFRDPARKRFQTNQDD